MDTHSPPAGLAWFPPASATLGLVARGVAAALNDTSSSSPSAGALAGNDNKPENCNLV